MERNSRIRTASAGLPLFRPAVRFFLLFAILFYTGDRFFSRPSFKKTDRTGIIGPFYPLFVNLNAFRALDGVPQAFGFAETDHTTLRGMS